LRHGFLASWTRERTHSWISKAIAKRMGAAGAR
jgi:hypothetical protein